MSTSYYRLMEPLTRLVLDEQPQADVLTVFDERGDCGHLILGRGVGRRLALRLAEQDGDDRRCPMRTHWGGSERGAVVDVNPSGVGLADDITLVSEYGDVLTVGQVKARDGARRHDGMPTELFGYEETKR